MPEKRKPMNFSQQEASERISSGISIIIPAYNEQDGVGTVLEHIHEVLQDRGWAYELIVVDDGSDDDTYDIAGSVSDTKVLRHLRNRGYGAALKTGIRHAKFENLLITDADGTYPVHQIPELVERLIGSECDMVVGARVGKHVSIPIVRRPAKWFIRKLAEIVAGIPIPDLNSGLRVFRKGATLPFLKMLPEGFSFTTTITLAMVTNGYTVEYVPISYFQRVGKSKLRPIRDTLNFVHLVLRITLYFAPLKIFVPISMVLIVVAIAWAVFSTIVLGRLADTSAIVIFMTGVQVGVLGLLAELLDRRLPSFHRPED
jgi:glycosyltransferase involved in cell wall biosynthesis